MDILNNIIKICITSSISIIVLFFISKLLGKKQIAQLEYIDYVTGISIGSIAAEMATDISDKPMYYYIIAMIVFFILDSFITLIGRKSPALKHFFKGKPLTIIYEGKLDYKALKKSKLDVNDVIAMCREQGYFDISVINYAIFENSGELSILPKGENKPVEMKDVTENIKKTNLPYYIIADGKISYSTLSQINKTESWLYSKLKIQNKKQLKYILLAIYNEENNEILIMRKN